VVLKDRKRSELKIVNEESMTEMEWDIALAGNCRADGGPRNGRSVNDRNNWGHLSGNKPGARSKHRNEE
jgi:hypothetical protein